MEILDDEQDDRSPADETPKKSDHVTEQQQQQDASPVPDQ